MGEITGIAWTDHTFNAWIGCTEAGPGCDSCYARAIDARYQYGVKPSERIPGVAPHWGPDKPRYRTRSSNWQHPLAWNRKAEERGVPAKVFCNSLSDVFDNEVPRTWLNDLFDLWVRTPWLRWQITTKRIGNAPKMLKGPLPPNCGIIATMVNQEEINRDFVKLAAVPARFHGISIEPQIGPVLIPRCADRMVKSLWCITGGESRQPGSATAAALEPRPYRLEWIRSLLDQKAEIPNLTVFVKQTGANPDRIRAPKDGAGSDPKAWPAWMRVQEFPSELTQ